MIDWTSMLLWGFVATVALTGTLMAAQMLGYSRMSLPFMIGTVMTPDRGRAKVYGFLAHFANGMLIAVVYAFIFESWGTANWWAGALMGLFHAGFVLATVMPLLPNVHPRMAEEWSGPETGRTLQPPGFLALNYGWRTPLFTVAAHVVYGAILGAFYHIAA